MSRAIVFEAGQMGTVPWAMVTFNDGRIQKYNMATLEGVRLLETTYDKKRTQFFITTPPKPDWGSVMVNIREIEKKSAGATPYLTVWLPCPIWLF